MYSATAGVTSCVASARRLLGPNFVSNLWDATSLVVLVVAILISFQSNKSWSTLEHLQMLAQSRRKPSLGIGTVPVWYGDTYVQYENTRTVGHLDAQIMTVRIRYGPVFYRTDGLYGRIRWIRSSCQFRAVLSSDRSGVLGTARHRIGERCGLRDDHLDVVEWFGSIGTAVGITD
jgi:hypothetical protein